jgi:hypothetical protein
MLYEYINLLYQLTYKISYLVLTTLNRVEDAVIRYLNRKPAAGSDAPGST